MDSLAAKWDNKFTAQRCEDTNACDVLLQNQHLLPSDGVALDYACGLGANALLLARHNLDTNAWDISTVALKKLTTCAESRGLKICTLVRDVEKYPPAPDSFDVIVVSNFLHRPSFPRLVTALRRNGLFFYQTFIANKISELGPKNPDYLLATNELLRLCKGLEILVYREEGKQGNTTFGFRNQAMVVAKKN